MVNESKIINGIKIDPLLFTFKFNCKCNGECCNYGVYTDLKEHDMIMSIKDKVIPLMDETQEKNIEKWFEQPEEDDDFDSGVAVGTEIINGKCTFLDKDGLCVLQRLAVAEGLDKWHYKPLYCILFPLTVYQGSLTIDDEHIDRLKYCNKTNDDGTTIIDHCREELIHFLGEEGFNELLNFRNQYLAMQVPGKLK